MQQAGGGWWQAQGWGPTWSDTGGSGGCAAVPCSRASRSPCRRTTPLSASATTGAAPPACTPHPAWLVSTGAKYRIAMLKHVQDVCAAHL